MLRPVVFATVESHEGVGGPVKARGHIDICGPCYLQRSWGCLCSGLLPESVLMSVCHTEHPSSLPGASWLSTDDGFCTRVQVENIHIFLVGD